MHSFTDSTIQNFAPMVCKNFEKPANKKPRARFYPRQSLEMLHRGAPPMEPNKTHENKLVHVYLNFKKLMLTIDPDDDDDDDNPAGGNQSANHNPSERQLQMKLAQQTLQLRLQQLLQHSPSPAAIMKHSLQLLEQPRRLTAGVMLDPQSMDHSDTVYAAPPSISGWATSQRQSAGGGNGSATTSRRSAGASTPKGKEGGRRKKRKRKTHHVSDCEEAMCSDDVSSNPDWG